MITWDQLKWQEVTGPNSKWVQIELIPCGTIVNIWWDRFPDVGDNVMFETAFKYGWSGRKTITFGALEAAAMHLMSLQYTPEGNDAAAL